MSILQQKLEAGEFAITCEAGPPKGVDVEEELKEVEEISDLIDAFNVTDLQSSAMRMSSVAMCRLIEERGLETVYQMTCRDRNRLGLQSSLLGAWALGMRNVLALTGDYTTLGDHPQAKPVFDLDSIQLLETIQRLNNGEDLVGNELQGSPQFFAGAAANPGADPLEPQIIKSRMKAHHGAKFFQTQAVYDPQIFAKFMEELRSAGVDTPVMVGILPLKSAGMARFMDSNIAGVVIPDGVIQELTDASDTVQKSLEICARVINETADVCEGVHLMPMGWEKYVPDILSQTDL